ncbi:hypothetical protein JCM16163A_40770 [Paenibacillus sp. YK5]
MNVKVIKSEQDTFWYADRIGETFPVLGTMVHKETLHFKVPSQDKTNGHYISADDCHIVIDEFEFSLIERN